MNIKEILNYSLIETNNLHITVYNLLMVAVILIMTEIIIWILHRIFKKSIYPKPNIDIGKSHTIYRLIKYFLWITAILLVLQTIGLKVTFILAGSAALLVGLGLGLQEIFRDIVSGLILLFERNMKINDVVEVEEAIGKVKEIGFRTTKVETRDNIIHIIPNSKFITREVINWSHIEKLTRFSVNVGVAYGSDVRLVEKVLHDCAINHQKISKRPDPFVRFNDFGESSLEFQIFFWTDESFYVENIKSELRFEIDRKFRENKIHIPFPQS
ncbi:MAG: mechanosensitive ion channel, partial [Bacteroidales bacterium]|nr:mechanosensitive ion channel [Bacteroidales bacterium]